MKSIGFVLLLAVMASGIAAQVPAQNLAFEVACTILLLRATGGGRDGRPES